MEGYAQADTIRLINASFEGVPQPSRIVSGWYDCGKLNFPSESPPDIQPGSFRVTNTPNDGNSFLGLVVRDNETWEGVAQRLQRPLEANKCYSFQIFIAKSERYLSPVGGREAIAPEGTTKTDSINHDTPVTLRIWGGNGYCDKQELLHQTSVITHNRWIEYNLKFEPKRRISHFMLEAFYKTPNLFPYNGNILLDNASEIILMPCDENDIPAPILTFSNPPNNNLTTAKQKFTFQANAQHVDKKDQLTLILNGDLVESFEFDNRSGELLVNSRLKKGTNTLKIRATNVKDKTEKTAQITYNPPVAAVTPDPPTPPDQQAVADSPPPPKENKYDKKEIITGATIRIDNLYFPADSTSFKTESYQELNELYEYLKRNPSLKIEIGGHTNGTPPHEYCDRLSTGRAKAVADYLADKGIDRSRLTYKGYGKRKPIATNKTKEGRTKNQRVEFRIL